MQMNILQISGSFIMRIATDAEILAYCTKCLNKKHREFCHQDDCAMFSGPKPDPDPAKFQKHFAHAFARAPVIKPNLRITPGRQPGHRRLAPLPLSSLLL